MKLIKLGITQQDAAAACSVTPKSFRRELSTSFPSLQVRWRLEAKLFNYDLPLWTEPGILRLRNRCQAEHGFDPFLVPQVEIKTHARKLGVPLGGVGWKQREIADAIIRHLSANPKLKSTIPQ